MGYQLGVDIGTTFTAAAIHHDGDAQVLPLSTESALVPSLVGLHPEGPVVVGTSAAALADYDESLVASAFKRRMGDPTPIEVAGTPHDASWYMACALAWVADNASHQRGERPQVVAVTHPANWHSHKITRMQQAIVGANLDPESTVLLTEPEAAAIGYAAEHDVAVGETMVVYDLGGGTFDTAVLRREATGFTILGRPQGMERLGGLDFDAAIYRYVTDRLGPAFNKLDRSDPAISRQLARLRQDCISAKEALSFHTRADVAVAVGPLRQQVELTRSNFESLIHPVLMESIGAVRRLLHSAELDNRQISRILLAGGSSRIPLVAEVISSELGRSVAVDAEPKHIVALGAAHAAARSVPTEAAARQPVSNTNGATPPKPPVERATRAQPETPLSNSLELSLESETATNHNGSTPTPTPAPTPAAPTQIAEPASQPMRPADPTPSRPNRSVPATRRPPTVIADGDNVRPATPAPEHRGEPKTDVVAPASRQTPQPKAETPVAQPIPETNDEPSSPTPTVAAPQPVIGDRSAGTGAPPASPERGDNHMLGTTTAAFTPKPSRRRRLTYLAVAAILLIVMVGTAVVLRGILNNDQPQEAGGSSTSLAEPGSWPSTITMSIKTVPGVNIEQLVVVQILEDELGIDIDVRPSSDYVGVVDDLSSGTAGLGILDAFNYSIATGAGSEIEPAAVQTDEPGDPGYTHSYGLTAIDNDNVRSLDEFSSGVVCFADRDSLSGFRMPASGLKTVGVDLSSASSPVTVQIAGSETSAVRFIADGTCPVGFVSSEAIADLLLDGDLPGLADATGEVGETNPSAATLKVVWQSPKIMNGPMAMSSSLPQSLREAISETLANKANRQWAAANGYCRDSDASCTINSNNGWGYAPTTDVDFDGMRQLCRPGAGNACRP